MALLPTTVPLASVIIPCYNGEKYLAEAIQSAINQTYRPLEVLVVDDASTDHSAEIADAFGPPVRVLRNERNMERSWSRNRGAHESKGEFLAFLDADDLWLPDKLAVQVPLLQVNPTIGLAYGSTKLFEDRDGIRVFGVTFGGAAQGVRADRLFIRSNCVPIQSAVVRRTSFETVGGFDCTPWVQGCEDYDLWLRMAQASPVLFRPEVLAYYRQHAAQSTRQVCHMALIGARVRWRHIRRFPDVLAGKSRYERWLDRYKHLSVEARKALAREDSTTAVRLYLELIRHNPWHPLWYSGLSTAIRAWAKRKQARRRGISCCFPAFPPCL